MLLQNLYVPFNINGAFTEVQVTHDAMVTNTPLYLLSISLFTCGMLQTGIFWVFCNFPSLLLLLYCLIEYTVCQKRMGEKGCIMFYLSFTQCPNFFGIGDVYTRRQTLFQQILRRALNPSSIFGLHFQYCKLSNISIMFKSCPIVLFYFSDLRKNN